MISIFISTFTWSLYSHVKKTCFSICRYELVPHGMVNRILPRASPETIEVFEKRGDAAMAHMLRALPTLPILPGDDHKYSEETVLKDSVYAYVGSVLLRTQPDLLFSSPYAAVHTRLTCLYFVCSGAIANILR
jgi:hypothetical protein